MQVTIDRPNLAGLMNSVCSIKSDRKAGLFGGHGVFIMPDVILTSWHLVKQSRNLTIIGPDGREAEMVRGSSFAKRSERLDMATVELSRPLSSSVVIHTDTEMYAQNMKGFLVTAFSGTTKCHKAGVHRDRPLLDELFDNDKDVQHFLCDERVKLGYYGSPVFDARGRLISLVAAIKPVPLTDSTQDQPPSSEYPNGLYRFRGTRAEDTASFVRRALDI